MSANFRVKLTETELRIELFGNFDPKSAVELLAAVQAQLSHPITTCLLSTMGLLDCAESARLELVKLQRLLGGKGARTAWVDDRARFRGVALWVMHLAKDGNAKAVANPDAARRWLLATESREAMAERGAML